MRATCEGTASSATVRTNNRFRPLNGIHAKAYAANAAIAIGMIVATIAIDAEFSSPLATPPVASDPRMSA